MNFILTWVRNFAELHNLCKLAKVFTLFALLVATKKSLFITTVPVPVRLHFTILKSRGGDICNI